jgi:prepilin-type N-terminal cleavage/methylation domain-containing protein
MTASSPYHRRGMSLVELLVVVAILGMLAVAVLPNLSNSAESRRGREAARTVSGFIAKSQSRAIGRREWSGFILAATNTTSSFAAISLFLADVPPVYRGDTVPALLRITGSTDSTRTVSGTAGELTMSGTWPGEAGVQANDLIRFNGSGPWYQIDSGANPVTSASIRFEPRGFDATADEDVGYQLHNTPWPPSDTPLAFEVLRQPNPAGSPLSLGESRAVDLYWSGIGPPTLTVGGNAFGAAVYRPFAITATDTVATAGASTAVLFDGTGRLRQAIVRSGETVRRIAITGPLYLLVGRADRVGQGFASLNPDDDTVGANWQYADSFWIAIDPTTGVVKTAECKPNPGGSTDLERCVNSQTWIRQSLLGAGR